MKEGLLRGRILKGFIFSMFMILLIPVQAAAKDLYTLEEVLSLASRGAERLKIAEEDIFIASMGKDKAQAALIPKLTVYGVYNRYSEDKYSIGNTLIQAQQAYSYGLRIDQTYSLGGREFKLHDIAKNNIEKIRHDTNTVKDDYLISVASAFYDILRMQSYVDIARSNLQRLQKHRDAAEKRLKVGEATKTVLLRAEAELSGAKTELIRVENNLKLSKAVLARLVGITKDFDLKEQDESQRGLLQMVSLGLTALQSEALNNRSEIQSALLQQRLSVEQIKVAEAAYYPSISLEAVYNRADMEPATISLVKESLYGGIRINFPLYEGGLRRAEVREAEARGRQASLLLEDLKRSVAVDVQRAYLEYLTYQDSLRSNEDQVAFAKDNYNAVSRQFEYGLANSLDVMDANNLLVSSEQRLSETAYNIRLSLLKIKRALGRNLI